MSHKAYYTKSHPHKPLKGKDNYVRGNKVDCYIIDDILDKEDEDWLDKVSSMGSPTKLTDEEELKITKFYMENGLWLGLKVIK